MQPPRLHALMPSFNVTGYHITRQPGGLGSWDLRVDARNGDAITVDGIEVTEAQAFIKCLEKMLVHLAPDGLAEGTLSLDEMRAMEGLGDEPEPPASAGDPPMDPSGSPRTDPPSTGPQPAAAQLTPFATGGWIPTGTATQVAAAMVTAGEYVLPFLPPGGACFGGEWIVPAAGNPWPPLPAHGANYELRFDATAPLPTTHVIPQVVHVPPGEVISVQCTCQTIVGGTLADDPSCLMHHGVPTVYVFDGR